MEVVRNWGRGLRFLDSESGGPRGRPGGSSLMGEESDGKSRGTVSYRRGTVRIGEALTSLSGDESSDCALPARPVRLRLG